MKNKQKRQHLKHPRRSEIQKGEKQGGRCWERMKVRRDIALEGDENAEDVLR
jgi:hypothetical protein